MGKSAKKNKIHRVKKAMMKNAMLKKEISKISYYKLKIHQENKEILLKVISAQEMGRN